MPRIVLAATMLGVVVLAQPDRARGQGMPDGTWRGWLQQTDQDSIRVSYLVQHSGSHILITLTGRSGIMYDMSGAKLRDDVLTFDWGVGLGAFLYCRLTRRDGRTFEGTCNDRSPGTTGKGVRVWMMMTPPDSARPDE